MIKRQKPKNSFRGLTTPESLKLMLKIYICQDEDPLDISSLPDKESCETVMRSHTDALIYIVLSFEILIL